MDTSLTQVVVLSLVVITVIVFCIAFLMLVANQFIEDRKEDASREKRLQQVRLERRALILGECLQTFMVLFSICSSVEGISSVDAIGRVVLIIALLALVVRILMFFMQFTIPRIVFAVIGIPAIIIGYVIGNSIVCFSGVALVALAAFGGESK